MTRFVSALWPTLLAAALFIGAAMMVQYNLVFIQTLIGSGPGGMLLYVACIALLASIPFVSSLALMPAASALWGWPIAGLLTLVAWLISSIVVFEVVRACGKNLLPHVVSRRTLDRILTFTDRAGIPGMILMRAFLSSDVSIYTLALFSRVSRLRFILLSAAALPVPAFGYAYLGGLPFLTQIMLLGGAIVGVAVIIGVRKLLPRGLVSRSLNETGLITA